MSSGRIVIIYGVSFFQSQVVSPVLASERMNMPAILILLGQIIFGFFFGFLGADVGRTLERLCSGPR